MKTALFDFHLPADRIATAPAEPRDSSRMLVLKDNIISDKYTANLTEYIDVGDVVVFNNTKVLPAQLTGKRGEANIHITLHRSISDSSWKTFAKPAKRLKAGDQVIFAPDFSAIIIHKADSGEIELKFEQSDWRNKLNIYGKMPLPGYMKRQAQESDKYSYQTIYAQEEGAVAAPTAGLHFTPELMEKLRAKGAELVFVTLHVGAGTFQPVKADDTDEHIMHKEYAEISDSVAGIINVAHKNGKRVIAVGTTSLRVLESATDDSGQVKPYAGDTGIFITPGYKFKAVDILLTNFHLPRSTLFMLVSAFMGLERMQEAYRHAVEKNYRFYSYGDACLLIR